MVTGKPLRRGDYQGDSGLIHRTDSGAPPSGTPWTIQR